MDGFEKLTWLTLLAVVVPLGCDPGGSNRDDAPPAGLGTLTADGNGSDTDAAPDTSPDGTDSGVTGGQTSGDGNGSTSSDPDDLPKFDVPVPGGSGGVDLGCDSLPDEDRDGDGWTKNEGDCNDCDGNVNPGAIEVEVTEPNDDGVIPDPSDENCDGMVDNVTPPCDGALSIDGNNPYDAAAAIGLCDLAEDPLEAGLMQAQWVRADGSVLANVGAQHGVMSNFGTNVMNREGSNLLVVSTGSARTPGQTDFCNAFSCSNHGAGTAPPGFPQDVPQCPGNTSIFDDLALEVTLRAPTNATGFSFDFDFYSYEYPEWVCDDYNDQFIALVDPPPEGSIDGNISFDSAGNPVSVNIAFFDVCSGCPLGTDELAATGFDTLNDAGATSWLSTTSPVTPGAEFTIRFMLWDTGDQLYDSTALIDNFQWIADGGTVDVGTNPAG